MRVKIASLKANLSRYVRQVQRTGEPVEVCVREDAVAYLAPAGPAAPDAEAARAAGALRARLRAAGLRLVGEPVGTPLPAITAATAGDRRTDRATVAELRAERGW